MPKQKSLDECFYDWLSRYFGYGYGSGEYYIIKSLQDFFNSFRESEIENCKYYHASYDYRQLEQKLGGPITWFLINFLAEHDYIEYGSSPRFGWTTTSGGNLKRYLENKSPNFLASLSFDDECYEDISKPYGTDCHCVEYHSFDLPCNNPFFVNNRVMEESEKSKNDPRWSN